MSTTSSSISEDYIQNRIVTINGELVLADSKNKVNIITTYGKHARLYEVLEDGSEILISLDMAGETIIALRKKATYRLKSTPYYSPYPQTGSMFNFPALSAREGPSLISLAVKGGSSGIHFIIWTD